MISTSSSLASTGHADLRRRPGSHTCSVIKIDASSATRHCCTQRKVQHSIRKLFRELIEKQSAPGAMALQASARSLALPTLVSCLIILVVGTSYVSTAAESLMNLPASCYIFSFALAGLPAHGPNIEGSA